MRAKSQLQESEFARIVTERDRFRELYGQKVREAQDDFRRLVGAEAERDRLREALEHIADGDFASTGGIDSPFGCVVRERARTALAADPEPREDESFTRAAMEQRERLQQEGV